MVSPNTGKLKEDPIEQLSSLELWCKAVDNGSGYNLLAWTDGGLVSKSESFPFIRQAGRCIHLDKMMICFMNELFDYSKVWFRLNHIGKSHSCEIEIAKLELEMSVIVDRRCASCKLKKWYLVCSFHLVLMDLKDILTSSCIGLIILHVLKAEIKPYQNARAANTGLQDLQLRVLQVGKDAACCCTDWISHFEFQGFMWADDQVSEPSFVLRECLISI